MAHRTEVRDLLVVCAACGRHYLGTCSPGQDLTTTATTSAYSRQRYGTDTCPAERVDAARLDAAVLESLLQTYENQRLLDESVEEHLAR